MKRYITYITTILVALLALGCAKFDDMSKNNYAIYETTTESFVQPILYKTEYQVLQSEYNILGHIMQYTVSTNYESTAQLAYNYSIADQYTNHIWAIYKQFGDAQYMLAQAENDENPAMKGVALVLRTYIAALLTDTYGDVPYFKAGIINLQGDKFDYMVPYDKQRDIYIDLFRSLEEANNCFLRAESIMATESTVNYNFDANCDYTFDGDINKWRRFGNSLYLRLLVRAAMKVQEESGNIISLGGEYGDINVLYKIAEIYNSFISGGGQYPTMRSVNDSARVKFDKMNSALYTPFYTTTSGSWNAAAACETIVNMMIHKDDSGTILHEDPRYYRIFHKPMGAPTQILRSDMKTFFDTNISSAGNSTIGRYTRGLVTGAHTGDMQNGPSYAMMNYDELCFLFAEAGVRGWITMSGAEYKSLYLEGCRNSIIQWHVDWEKALDYLAPNAKEITAYVDYLSSEFKYDTALEQIMTQKYIATLWVGVESWADYRRTGYPMLKTNGPAAENKGVLPTRLRYPTTESFQNATNYNNAVNDWLGGENNMLVDMWWASTAESQANRAKGRQ